MTLPDQPAASSGRLHLYQQMERLVSACQADTRRFALLVFNLQKFREINIYYGHQLGDAVLAQVAERVGRVLRPDDKLFHLGSDEFAVLLTGVTVPQVVELAMAKILEAISATHEVEGNVLAVSAVAGGALYPDHADNRADLLKAADAALHYAREQHVRYCIFDASVRLKEQRWADLKNDLRHALDNAERVPGMTHRPQFQAKPGAIGSAVTGRKDDANKARAYPEMVCLKEA